MNTYTNKHNRVREAAANTGGFYEAREGLFDSFVVVYHSGKGNFCDAQSVNDAISRNAFEFTHPVIRYTL